MEDQRLDRRNYTCLSNGFIKRFDSQTPKKRTRLTIIVSRSSDFTHQLVVLLHQNTRQSDAKKMIKIDYYCLVLHRR